MNKSVILSGSLAVILLLSGNHINAQTGECKVKIPGISGTYSGGCKNGLADGKGIAQGVDLYKGQFREGVPHGKGTYTWAGGTYYEGSWRYGLKDGKGKLVSTDSIVSGYWRADAYIGKEPVPSYKVTRSLSVIRSTITKSICADNKIKMQFLRAGVPNAGMSDFAFVYNSGIEFTTGPYVGLYNTQFPLDIKVTFRAYNYLRTAQYDVIFEFTINEPGCWDVNVSY
jgi:hypothetical protein